MNLRKRMFLGAFCLGLMLLAFGGSSYGQMSLTQPNTPTVENFNGLGTAAPANLPSGWRIDNAITAPAPNTNGANPNSAANYNNSQTQTLRASTGTDSAGGAYNFGDASNTADRGIGFLGSGSFLAPRNIFVQLRNDTGQTITNLDISFRYEQYRAGGRSTNMTFSTGISGSAPWTAVPAGSQTFNAESPGATNGTLINPAGGTTKTFTLSNVNIPAGQVYYLRWEYVDSGSGARQGIGIDDVSVTPRTAGGGTTPTIITSNNTLPDFGAVAIGTTSPEKSYTISGTNLTDNITVTAPAEFLVSTTSGENYAPTVTLTQNGGTVQQTTIYVVMAPTSVGPKSGSITNASSGATTQNVNVSGNATQSFTVNGQIIYKGTQPLAGITVTAISNGSVAGSAVTDANGGYAISLPGGGTYTLSVVTAPFTFSAPTQTVANLSGNQTVNFGATGAAVLISEFRFRGNGSADEFVELYNNTDAAIDISGFALASSENPSPKFIVPGDPGSRTTTIPARGHYLLVGAGYSLAGYAVADGFMVADIPDGAGVSLFINASTIAPQGRIDSVGFAGAGPLFTEGTALNPPGGVAVDAEVSFVRNPSNNGYSNDTDNNAADFSFVSTSAGIFGGVQSILGAPGPENRQGPIFSPANVTGGVFDAGAAPTAAPNRIVDTNETNGGLTPAGTISTRTTYTNRAPLAITRFRLRIIRFTTVGSPTVYNPQAIARALNTADVTVTKSDGSSVPVKGTIVEGPPAQPQAGGLNSSLIVNLSQPINPGESINVDLKLGFVQSGRSVFNTVVEANLAAPATASEHLVLGNPSNATTNPATPNNYLLDKAQYAVGYNCSRGVANWVSWHLDTSWLGSAPRQNDFRADTTLPAGCYQVQGTDYSGSGFDRGHHTPSADRTSTVADNSATFLMTNMMPQAPDNNQGPWEQLESYSRSLVAAGNELYIIAGGAGTGGTGSNGGVTNSIAGGRVAVPNVTYKVIVVLPVGGGNDAARVTTATRVIAVIMPNTQGIRNNDWRSYRVSVDQIEALTGLDFLTNVNPAIQAAIESAVDNQ